MTWRDIWLKQIKANPVRVPDDHRLSDWLIGAANMLGIKTEWQIGDHLPIADGFRLQAQIINELARRATKP